MGGSQNNIKEKEYETGGFDLKIKKTFFSNYEVWLEAKHKEYLLEKAKKLEKNLYKNFNIDKKINRKKVNNIINEKKEEL